MRNRSPRAPTQLSLEAKGWWSKILKEWELDDPSLLVLESALESFDRMRQAQRIIEREGVIVKDRFGQPRENPAVAIEYKAKTLLVHQIKALGLDLEPLNERPGRPSSLPPLPKFSKAM